MSKLRALPVLLGAGVGLYAGLKYGKRTANPLWFVAGPVFGAGLGAIVTGKLNQGPNADPELTAVFGRLTPTTAFNSSSKALEQWTEADLRNPLNSLLNGIRRARPRTSNQVGNFFANVLLTATKETGKSNISDGGVIQSVAAIPDSGPLKLGSPAAQQLGPLYGRLRRSLIAQGARRTQLALRDAAAWFHASVEGKQPSILDQATDLVAGSPTGGQVDPQAQAAAGWWSQQGTGTKVAIVVGGLSVIGGLVYALASSSRPRGR